MTRCPEILPGLELPFVWTLWREMDPLAVGTDSAEHILQRLPQRGTTHHSPGLNRSCVKFCAFSLLLYLVNKYQLLNFSEAPSLTSNP